MLKLQRDWDELLEILPQKPPFRFVDRVVDATEKTLTTEKEFTGEEDFFQGHFPGFPIMPGVLLCEAVFQTGALLMLAKSWTSANDTIGVVTRIRSTKFKHFVRPQDTLRIQVELTEQIDHVFHMKGTIRVAGQLILSIEFSGAEVEKNTLLG